jgi:hypothetical protein
LNNCNEFQEALQFLVTLKEPVYLDENRGEGAAEMQKQDTMTPELNTMKSGSSGDQRTH